MVGSAQDPLPFGEGGGPQPYTELWLTIIRRAYDQLDRSPTRVSTVLAEEGLFSPRRRAGKLAAYSEQTIWNWLRGDAVPDIEVVLALARRTNQSLDVLLGLRAAEERERRELINRLQETYQAMQDYVDRQASTTPRSGARRRPARPPRPPDLGPPESGAEPV